MVNETIQIDWHAIRLDHPRKLREAAARRYGDGRAVRAARVHYVSMAQDEPQLVIQFLNFPTPKLTEVAMRLDSYLWTTSFRNKVRASRLNLEDLRIDREDGFLVRLVRHGVPCMSMRAGVRYELASFTFRILRGPLALHAGSILNPELGDDECPLVTTPQINTPADLAGLIQGVESCAVEMPGPLMVDGFYHEGRIHRVRKEARAA